MSEHVEELHTTGCCSCCSKPSHVEEDSWLGEHRDEALMAASGSLIVLGFVLYLFENTFTAFSTMKAGLFVLAALIGLYAISPAVVHALKHRKIDMNILMSIAVIGAIFLGAYVEAAIVIFLDQVGEALEAYAMKRTRGSIRNLMSLAPQTAQVKVDGTFEEKSVEEIATGSVIRVLPGERIPLDGIVSEGLSAVDESPVTGESLPVDKTSGDTVYAGSLNTYSVLTITTTADASDSMLARIVSLVEGAQARRAPHEEFIDRFAAKYTPAVFVVALCIACVPPLWGLITSTDVGHWTRWVYSALTVLVISCPCALVISTPVSLVSGITRAARMGVLVKGGAVIDQASKVDTIAFDKTGTLTEGKPEVIALIPAPGVDKTTLLEAAYALEVNSTHPLAQSITAYVRSAAVASQLTLQEAEGLVEHTSCGVEGSVNGVRMRIGKEAFIDSWDAMVAPQAAHQGSSNEEAKALLAPQIHELQDRGATVLVIACEDQILGLVGLSDCLRKEASEAISGLSSYHLEILTGDNDKTAAFVGQQLGVTQIKARCVPQDKIDRVTELVDSGRVVAMVGDGINDAPALAGAHVGVTMGVASSDTALEVADVALMTEDLSLLATFFKLARKTMGVVRQNIVLAIAIKVLVLVLALFGKTAMWMAVFADTGVTVLVILNGMRLMLGSLPKKRTHRTPVNC